MMLNDDTSSELPVMGLLGQDIPEIKRHHGSGHELLFCSEGAYAHLQHYPELRDHLLIHNGYKRHLEPAISNFSTRLSVLEG